MERFGKLGAGFALLLLLQGCGAATTAPVLPGDNGGSPDDTTATQSQGHDPTPLGDSQGGLGTVLDALRGLILDSVALVGDVGGGLDNGRWHATVPSAAIQGGATITIAVQSSQAGQCLIEVTPADKNKFDVPATVRVDAGPLSDTQLAQSVLYEFDPVQRKWFEVPGSTVDMNDRSVSAPVDHFAQYSVGPAGGKAGW